MGYDVGTAHTGPDGLEQALSEDWRAILLDVMLPGMDGFEVLEQLRRTSAVPVLMLTDESQPRPCPIILLFASHSLRAGGLFFDLTPWVVVGFAAVIFSVLFWIPMVRNVTRSISQIAAEAKEGGVAITVTDQGPGVPEQSLQQIFDPFFRGEPSRSRDTGGIGLGLAIVRSCVEACQGTVTARNRQPSGLQVRIDLKPGT